MSCCKKIHEFALLWDSTIGSLLEKTAPQYLSNNYRVQKAETFSPPPLPSQPLLAKFSAQLDSLLCTFYVSVFEIICTDILRVSKYFSDPCRAVRRKMGEMSKIFASLIVYPQIRDLVFHTIFSIIYLQKYEIVWYPLISCAFSWPYMVKWRNSGIIMQFLKAVKWLQRQENRHFSF